VVGGARPASLLVGCLETRFELKGEVQTGTAATRWCVLCSIHFLSGCKEELVPEISITVK
jgi:hypothetical protein